MATEPVTTTEYISHHLQNWHAGEGFWSVHVDTLVVSGLVGLAIFLGMAYAARRASSGVPGGFQNFVEMVLSMLDNQVKDTFHAKSRLVTPLAITIFIWVFLMNAIDLIPVDFIPQAVQLAGGDHFRAVPTADPNTRLTPINWFGVFVGVLLLVMAVMAETLAPVAAPEPAKPTPTVVSVQAAGAPPQLNVN